MINKKMQYYKELPHLDCTQVTLECNAYINSIENFSPKPWSYQPIDDFEDFLKKVPSLTELFKPLNITPTWAAFFVVSVPDTIIHRDMGTERTTCRINLPVRNCEYSETTFYEPKPGYTPPPAENKLFSMERENCVVADKISLKCPTVLAVGYYHNVHMTSLVYDRIALTIGFKEDISHMLFGRE